jgi:hypothetical protein
VIAREIAPLAASAAAAGREPATAIRSIADGSREILRHRSRAA